MINQSIGFEVIPEDELHMLLCFDNYGELILPDLIPNGNAIISNLIRKDIVLDKVPYCLSKRGLKLYHHYMKYDQQRIDKKTTSEARTDEDQCS